LPVHPAEHLRKPVMQRTQKRKPHASEHYIMEMGNYPICAVQMQVCRNRALYEACETSDGKQKDERQRVQHGGVEPDGPLIQRAQPIKYLHTARHGNKKCEE